MEDLDFVPSSSGHSSPIEVSSPENFIIAEEVVEVFARSNPSQRPNAWLSSVYVQTIDDLPLGSVVVDDDDDDTQGEPMFLTTAQKQVLDIINANGERPLRALPSNKYDRPTVAGFEGRVEFEPCTECACADEKRQMVQQMLELRDVYEAHVYGPLMKQVSDAIPEETADNLLKAEGAALVGLKNKIIKLLNGGAASMADDMLVKTTRNTARSHIFEDCSICLRVRTAKMPVSDIAYEEVVSVVDLGCGGTETRHTMCVHCFRDMFRVFCRHQGDVPAQFRCPHCRADILTPPTHYGYRFRTNLWVVDKEGDLVKHPEFEARLAKSKFVFAAGKRRKRRRETVPGDAAQPNSCKRNKPLPEFETENA